MGLFEKKDGYLGVDIGAHGIKLVELKKNKGRPQLWTYGTIQEKLDINKGHEAQVHEADTSLDEYRVLTGQAKKEEAKAEVPLDVRIDRYAQLLRQLVKQAKVTSGRATASLPVSQVFHSIVTLPVNAEKEIDHHVKAKVKKMLPLPIEDMQVVHQVVPDKVDKEKRKYLRVLVTAAPRQLVSFYSSIFSKAGLQLEELETEAFALERSLIGHDQATSLIIDMGAERSNFFMVDGGVPITHRSIHVGGNQFDEVIAQALGIEPHLVGQVKRDMSLLPAATVQSDLYEELLDPIVKEIGYSLELFTSQTGNEGKRLQKIILTGGSALFPPIQTAIADRFPIKVFVGDPWARVVYQQGLKPVLDAIGPRMAVSIGLAMRNVV